VRIISVVTLTLVAVAFGSGNGSAAAVTGNPAFVYRNPVAKKAEPKVETYQERLDRIAESPRSLLRPLQENKDKATVCVSGEFTTLGVVYDSLWESIFPLLPAPLRENAKAAKVAAHRDMKRIHVSTLAVSNNPMARGADRSKQGGARYRTATSAWVVESLLKVRDGKQNEAIALENISLQQAVETAWLYIFATVVAPLRLTAAFLPYTGSLIGGNEHSLIPLTNPAGAIPASLWSFFASFITGTTSYNALLNLGFSGWQILATYVYQAISNAFINQCVARVTEEQRDAAGKPSDTVTYDIPIAPIIQEAADQVALADAETCKPVSSLPLSRIVTRTADYVEKSVPNPAHKKQVRVAERDLMRIMRTTRIPHNLIPADPADFTFTEQMVSLLAGLAIPFVGGAPFDVLIGLNNNREQGLDFGETVALSDLTVTKSLTAAYYVYYVTLWLIGFVGGYIEAPIASALGLPGGGELGAVSFTRMLVVTMNLPLVHGLVNFHNVVRSMCFREDDTTGTGRGAEYRKDNAKLPKALTPAEQREWQKQLRAQRARAKRAQAKRAQTKPQNQRRSAQRPSAHGPAERE